MKDKLFLFAIIGLLVGVFLVPPPEDAKAAPDLRHSPDFYALASMGKITGIRSFRKFGVNPDVDNADIPETVCSVGGSVPHLFTSTTVKIVSSSTADTDGGTGMQQVYIEGVSGENDALTSETVVLNGQTQVTLANEYTHINTAYGVLSGSGENNAGTISIQFGDAETVGTEIPAGNGQTQCFNAMVPAGHMWLIDNITASQDKKGTGTVTLHYEIMLNGSNTWRNILNFGLDAAGTSKSQVLVGAAGRFFALPPRARIRALVDSASSNDNQVTTSAAGFLVDLSKFKY